MYITLLVLLAASLSDAFLDCVRGPVEEAARYTDVILDADMNPGNNGMTKCGGEGSVCHGPAEVWYGFGIHWYVCVRALCVDQLVCVIIPSLVGQGLEAGAFWNADFLHREGLWVHHLHFVPRLLDGVLALSRA